jgi:hypothetical protein
VIDSRGSPSIYRRLTWPEMKVIAAQHGLKPYTILQRYQRGDRGERLIRPRDPRGGLRKGAFGRDTPTGPDSQGPSL